MGMEKVTECDRMPSVSPVLLPYSQWRKGGDGMGKNGDGRVPLLNGDGTALGDRHGQLIYESPGWYLLHDLHGYMVYDENGDLCFEEVDEDQLALMMWSVPRRAPITAEQVDSMIEQNQQLQSELDQSLLAHS